MRKMLGLLCLPLVIGLAGCASGAADQTALVAATIPSTVAVITIPVTGTETPLSLTSSAPPPMPSLTSDPPLPIPTTPPLPVPLTAGEALALALERDTWMVSREPAPAGAPAASATVTLYDSLSAADAALGQQTSYAAEVEADAGPVWLVSLSGPFWNLTLPGAGHDQWAVFDGIHYQYSARTGLFLGLLTGPRLPGMVLLFARDDDLYRADVAGGVVEPLTTGGRLGWGMASGDEWWIMARLHPPRLSPDGRRIAFSPDGDSVVVLDARIPDAEPLTVVGSAVFAWSPDSRRLAYDAHVGDAQRAQLLVYDFDEGATASLLDELASDIAALAWSPDGQRLAFGCCFEEDYSAEGEYLGTMTGQVRVVDLARGRVETLGELGRSVAGGVEAICWTEDNRVAGLEVNDTGQPIAGCSTPPDPSLSPAGQRRFYVSGPPQPATDVPNQLIVEDATGEAWRRDLEWDLWPVAWSPDGQYILLDDAANHSPIWRLPADGTGEPEGVVEDGHLLSVVAAWK